MRTAATLIRDALATLAYWPYPTEVRGDDYVSVGAKDHANLVQLTRELVAELQKRTKGSGCECCDHKLQHVIREFLNYYDNACPPMSVRGLVGVLRDALTQWEDDQ